MAATTSTLGAETAPRPVAGPATGEGRSLTVEDLEQRLSRQNVQLPPKVREDLTRYQQTLTAEGARPVGRDAQTLTATPAATPATTTSTSVQPAAGTMAIPDRARGLDRLLNAKRGELDRRVAARAEIGGRLTQGAKRVRALGRAVFWPPCSRGRTRRRDVPPRRSAVGRRPRVKPSKPNVR